MTPSNRPHASRRTPRSLALRAGVATLDLACCCGIAACLWAAASKAAQAYVDPSVMTYTIQALAGVAVALSAVLGVVWRRARRWLLGALRIDENAGKVVEPAVAAAPAAAGEAARAQAAREAAEERSLQGKEQPQNLPWFSRFALALVATITLCFATFVAAPLEVVAASVSNLSFSVASAWAPLAVFALIAAVVSALVISATRGRAYDVLVALVVALAAASLVQALCFNGPLPAADGSYVDWTSFTKITLVSCAVWVLIIAGLVALAVAKPVASKSVAVVACLVLILTQGVSLGASVASHSKDGGSLYVTEDGLMEVSDKRNVIVMVLDTFDTAKLKELVANHPDALSEMGGFTWFDNSTEQLIPTRYAIPSLVTGYSFDTNNTELTKAEIQSWFTQDNLISEAREQGWSVGVYSDSLSEGMDALSRQTVNVHALDDISVDPVSTVKSLTVCALYRNAPWPLKSHFRFYTDDLNRGVASKTEANPAAKTYIMDDPAYYQQLTSSKLHFEQRESTGAWRFIHLTGSHAPYIMNENAESVSEGESSLEQQNLGSLKIVSEYLRQLKELGVYENSTIILTADHGTWWSAENPPDETSPILLVKPAGADSSQPVVRSSVPTGHVDLPATLRAAFGVETSEPTVFDVTDEPRERYFYWIDHSEVDKMDHWLREWKITGDALDFSNWHSTGRNWPANAGY